MRVDKVQARLAARPADARRALDCGEEEIIDVRPEHMS
jgi:hypothetical protein